MGQRVLCSGPCGKKNIDAGYSVVYNLRYLCQCTGLPAGAAHLACKQWQINDKQSNGYAVPATGEASEPGTLLTQTA